MCELLITHSYFNYSQNIAQVLVPFLNHKNEIVREKVKATCETIFTEDKKGEMTLKVSCVIHILHLNNTFFLSDFKDNQSVSKKSFPQR